MKSFLIVTTDPAIKEALQTIAVTQGVAVVVVGPEEIADRWSAAGTVFVGVDCAQQLLNLGLPRRERVYLTGFDAKAAGVWSLPLGAVVATFPECAKWLPDVFAAESEPVAAQLVAVIGGSGGIGCSTLATTLAVIASRRKIQTALVDLDSLGGGLDLLLGAERQDGWRWPKFQGASGTVSDCRSMMLSVGELAVLSMARAEPMLARGPMAVVLDSLIRAATLVIVDVGRFPNTIAREVAQRANIVLAVVGTQVRAVAAARETIAAFGTPVQLLVRHSSGFRVSAHEVAQMIGSPLTGELPFDKGLVRAAQRGEPPGIARSKWRRACTQVLEKVAT